MAGSNAVLLGKLRASKPCPAATMTARCSPVAYSSKTKHQPPCNPGSQWAHALVKPTMLHSYTNLTTALKELCLTKCAGDASTALISVHKQLGDLAVRLHRFRVGKGFSPC